MILLLLETSMLQVERGEFSPPANKRHAQLIITEMSWTQHERVTSMLLLSERMQLLGYRAGCSDTRALGQMPPGGTCEPVAPCDDHNSGWKHTVLKAPQCLQINSKSDQDLRVETVSVWIFDVLCISLSCLKGWTDAQDSSRLQSH